MKRSGFILVLVLLTVLSCSKKNEMIEPVLKELDETIDNRQRFENEKQDRIARLKKDLQETNDIHKRTELYSSLFDQYKNYQYDSAFVYAKLLEKNALKEGSKIEYRAKSQVALLHCFKSVAEFYFLGAETWQNLSSFVSGTEALASKYDAEKLECYDKVLEYAAPDSYLYGYANLDKMLIENYSDSLAISARDAFIVMNDWDDHQKAVQYSILSEAYNKVQKYDEAVYYRALSAILDIRSCTHETTSAKVLAGHMYARGNIDRAYKYIQQAQYDAEFYNSRLRKAEISTILPIIENGRYNWLNNQRLLLFIILSVIAGLLALTVVLLLVLRSRNKVLAQTHADLAEKTDLLEKSNLSLTEAIAKLREANEIKDQYIIQSLYGNTAFVNEVNDAVNEAARDITLKRPDEARTTLYHIGIKKERARIAASFDTAFLKLFPNWLDEFNSLFPKESQIRLAEDGTMPMDVRIFALMRLGFDNAAEVAEYLNLSIDTVYVYKARLKGKALVDKEVFDSRIMAIPKP